MAALLHIMCQEANLKVVRGFVDNFTQSLLSTKDIGLVTMAIDEVCHNLLEHGGCQNIWLELDKEGDAVVIKIRDDGSPFDLNAYQPRSLEELVAGRATGGLGLRLVQKVMDNIVYKPSETLNECFLYKKRTILA